MWSTLALGAILAAGAGYWQFGRRPSAIAPIAQVRSLAVLPLENRSGDPAQDFFANAMSDALITELARVKELRVMSRDSSMQLRTLGKRLPDLARDLQIDGFIDGSVTRVGNQVRISAELIHAPSDQILWGDSYDGDLTDVLALQRRVAQDIARHVRVTVSPEVRRTLATSRAVQPRAQELYFRGREQLRSALNTQPFRFEGIVEAIRTYDEARALEPNWANPYAAIAEAKNWMSEIDPKRLFSESREAALTAIALDDEHADGHAALAYVLSAYFGEWTSAEREYERCIELNPSDECFGGYGMMLTVLRRFNEAKSAFERAKDRDPLSPQMRINSALSLIRAREFGAAEREAREMIAAGMDLRNELAWALAWQSRPDEAVEILRGLARENVGTAEDKVNVDAALISVLALAGKPGEALALLPALERANKDLERTTMGGAKHLARAYAHLGRRDAAITTLQRAYAAPPAWLSAINVDPSFDVLHDDARFQDLLRRMRLRE